MKLCVFRLCCVWNCEPACDLLTFFTLIQTKIVCMMWDVAHLVHHRTGTPPTQVRFPGEARDFSPSQLSCRLSYRVRTPPCAIARINICAHVIDPVVHIRVRWIIETLKHWTCTVVWVARLCRSWLSPGKAVWISHGRNPIPTIG